MKKPTILFLTLLIIFTAIISGCSNETIKNENNSLSFDYENDFQYYYNSLNGFNYPITKSDTGYYAFLPNRFLYYIDKELQEATPLCNKPNCAHNNKECNAYFNLYEEPSSNTCNIVQYYNDNLYVVIKNEDRNGEFIGTSLYRVSNDGSERKEIMEFKEGISHWLIHRGYFYFASVQYSDNAEDFSVYDSCSIKRLSINNMNSKAEELFNSKDYCDYLQSVKQFSAYGDYIFAALNPMSKKDIQRISNDENYVSEDNVEIFSINIKSLDANIVTNDGGDINPPTFYKGKLLYSLLNEDNGKKDKYYVCDLDGRNHKFIKEVKYGDNLFCNEAQVYSVNYLDLVKSKEHFQNVSVLDFELNPVSSFIIPIESLYIMNIPQDEEFFIFIHMDNNSTKIYSIDKTQLNNLNGKNAKYKILYSTGDNNNLVSNSISNIDQSISIDTDDEDLRAIFDKAKNKAYRVDTKYDLELDEKAIGGFTVNLYWNGDGGNYSAEFQILKFSQNDDVNNFVKKNPYSLTFENYVAYISIKTIPVEIKDMLYQIIMGEPVEPINSDEFSGNTYSFE